MIPITTGTVGKGLLLSSSGVVSGIRIPGVVVVVMVGAGTGMLRTPYAEKDIVAPLITGGGALGSHSGGMSFVTLPVVTLPVVEFVSALGEGVLVPLVMFS
jgi:hypothetical protein